MAVIAATSSDPERYLAKGPAPRMDNAMHIGISIRRAIATDRNAGVAMTFK